LLTLHHITTMPDAMVRESQRLFGEYVIPALRETPVSTSAG
jgi:hypothetical protein